jgi:hypothetical protein
MVQNKTLDGTIRRKDFGWIIQEWNTRLKKHNNKLLKMFKARF